MSARPEGSGSTRIRRPTTPPRDTGSASDTHQHDRPLGGAEPRRPSRQSRNSGNSGTKVTDRHTHTHTHTACGRMRGLPQRGPSHDPMRARGAPDRTAPSRRG
eukprot:1525808-Prymnesium_polylepis.1